MHDLVFPFLGFGKSDKYTNPDNYTHELHCFTLRKLLDHLDVKDLTLVCQDWGGLTGLSVVKDAPDRFSNLVIMNTGVPSPVFDFRGEENGRQDLSTGKVLIGFLPFTVWKLFNLLMGTHLPVRKLFDFSFGSGNVETGVLDAYAAPFPSRLFKAGTAKWPQLVPMLKDDPVCVHMENARNCLKTWRKPALIMFGDSDPVTKGAEAAFLNLIPHHKRIPVKGARHFLQETHGEIVSENIIKFLGDSK